MASAAAVRKQKQLNECLLWAVEKNELDKLKYYLNEGASVDKADAYKRTSLIKATQNANLDAFESLIAHGASINKADVEGETALIHASYNGCYDILCRLVELGAYVHHMNKNDETSVYIASKYGHYDCMRRLVMVGADYATKSKFGKTALDAAVDSMYKSKRQKREDKCQEYERIVELLSDSKCVEDLRKQEKMFTLTPEEFRLCLERSEYRQADVNVRLIGLNDDSVMAVTRALIRQSSYSADHGEMADGICFFDGLCEMDIDTGKWTTHEKISERDMIFRQMGEVVRNYVNTHNFESDVQCNKKMKQNKHSYLFRNNTMFTPSPSPEPFTLSPSSNGLSRTSSAALLLHCSETFDSTSGLVLHRSKTSTSLYSLKSNRSAVSLTGMDLSFDTSVVDDNTSENAFQLPRQHTSANFRQIVQSAKKHCTKAVQSVKQKVDSLIHRRPDEITDASAPIIRNRKQVYDTFECVKRTMHTDNSNIAPISVCALSAKFDFVALHRFLFTTNAIYIFVIDADTSLNGPCTILANENYHFSNREYIEYLLHEISKRNEDVSDNFSKIIFVSLDNGGINQSSSENVSAIFSSLSDIIHGTLVGKNTVMDAELEFTLEELFTDKISNLTDHIYTLAIDSIQGRKPLPATWLALQETVISAKEISPGIISRKALEEMCMNTTKNIASPSVKEIEDFVRFQTTQGPLLSVPIDGDRHFVCLDISVLYQLVNLFRHVSVKLIQGENDMSSLYDKLKTVTNNMIDKKSTKCYVSVSDPLFLVIRSAHFVGTNKDRAFLDTENLDLFLPMNMSASATDSLMLQFQKFEYSPCFSIKFNNSLHVVHLFKLLSCAFFDIWPLKRIRGKNITFSNFLSLSVDNLHSFSIIADGNRIVFTVSRNTVENSTKWLSEIDLCNGIYTMTKYFVTAITNRCATNRNKKIDYEVEFDTCSRNPPCWISKGTLEKFDSYSCHKHDTFIDPSVICNRWKTNQVCPMIYVDECSLSCKGLPSQSLTENATDSILCKIIRRLSVNSRRRLLTSLSAELHIQPSHNTDNCLDQQLLFSLIKLRNLKPSLGDMQKFLVNNGEEKHITCKIYRQPNIDLVHKEMVNKAVKLTKASRKALHHLAVRFINKSLFLAVELGFDVVEYNHLLHKNRENQLKTTQDVLFHNQDIELRDLFRVFIEIGVSEDNLSEIAGIVMHDRD